MIITFITMEPPSLKKGGPVRFYNLIKQCVAQGNTVDVFTLVEPGENIEHLKTELGAHRIIAVSKKKHHILTYLLNAFINRIPPYFVDFRSSKLADEIVSYAKTVKPDIIQLELLHSYDALAPIIPILKAMGISVILDAHNVEYKTFIESISVFSWLKRLIGIYIAPRLLSIEIEAAKTIDHIFTCSEIDRDFFCKYVPVENVTVIPNGVDCTKFTPNPLVKENTLIFIGGTYYPPNDDALKFYFQDVHPLVKKIIPDVRITLLGKEPSPWLKKLEKIDPSIVIPGLVPDVRAYIYDARVCISPMRKGSGTSLKILEYMGSGKPIVSTKMGVRGISCMNGKEALIEDEPIDFANAVVCLLRDNELATHLGENARKTAELSYDWKSIGKNMVEIYRKLGVK